MNPYQSPQTLSKGRTRRLVWTHIFLACAVMGGASTSYFCWAWHRVSGSVLVHDDHWPRGNPYPDRWLAELNDWYDRRYPAPPRTIKIHGELDRVRLTVFACIVLSAIVFAIGAIPLSRPYRQWRSFTGENGATHEGITDS